MFDSELDLFKRSIDLRAYATAEGYLLDRRKSSRGSSVMRHINGDKIVVSRKPSGHYRYFSVRRDGDHGTIVDFIQNRRSVSLGPIRKELRDWTGATATALSPLSELFETPKNRRSVQSRYAAMRFADRHFYLEHERGIPAIALRFWRFRGRIKIDSHGNAVFPHFDTNGLCGYELRNFDFKGFSSGGTKGLWLSRASSIDQRLVICESAIDAISHSALFQEGETRYASVGGKLNGRQPHLIGLQIARMPRSAEIVAATDADLGGEQLAASIRRAFSCVAAQTFRREQPVGFKDWNDQLRARLKTIGFRPGLPVIA
jgi:hypothetical protein